MGVALKILRFRVAPVPADLFLTGTAAALPNKRKLDGEEVAQVTCLLSNPLRVCRLEGREMHFCSDRLFRAVPTSWRNLHLLHLEGAILFGASTTVRTLILIYIIQPGIKRGEWICVCVKGNLTSDSKGKMKGELSGSGISLMKLFIGCTFTFCLFLFVGTRLFPPFPRSAVAESAGIVAKPVS
jgi:hypothetical protein